MVRGDSQLATPRSRLKTAVKAVAYPLLLRLFDAALYVGQRSRAYYAHYGYPADRLFFSPHCVDTAWFAARATEAARHRLRAQCRIAPGATVLLFAGRLLPFKRPVDLILAAGHCRQRGINADVMVAGSGALEPDLKAAAASHGVPLHFLGFRNQTGMPAAYAAADCLALPSDGRESWGLVANEALACSRPIVVSSACGCAPDLASDGIAMSPPPPAAMAALSEAYSLKAAAAGIRAAADRIMASTR
jgi:glycosyltransferase involved in cell wall biosynthesis